MRRALRTGEWILWAVLCVGCGGEDDVRIIGACEVVTDAVRVTDDQGGFGGPRPSVGLLDDHVLVSWTSNTGTEWEPRAQWLDASLMPVGEPTPLGWGIGERTQWVRDGDALVGQGWVDPLFRTEEVREVDLVHVFTLRPGAPVESTPIGLDLRWMEGFAAYGIGTGILSSGFQTILPGTMTRDGFRGALVGVPGTCRDTGLTSDRLHMFGLGLEPAVPVQWEVGCDGRPGNPFAVSDPWLVDLGDEGIGVLLRLGLTADGRVYYIRVSPDGTLLDGPILVEERRVPGPDGGWQPHAAHMPGERIVFTVRRAEVNRCHAFRMMRADGTGARDAPWQLPCVHNDTVATASVEVVRVPGGAVVVWAERTWTDARPIVASTNYEEGIFATLLTPEGRRGSPIIRVTDPDATILQDVPITEDAGPFPAEFLVGATSNGPDVVVAWHDTRPSAPGVYVRRLRCEVASP